MLSFLTFIPSLLKGLFTTVNGITAAISNERIALIQAESDEDKAVIQANIAALQNRRDVMIAEAGYSHLNLWIRSLIAIGPTIYLLKIFIWDKVLASWTHGSTDPLDPNLWNVVMVVLGFYFLSESALGVTRILGAKK
jgi:hypothetical protein